MKALLYGKNGQYPSEIETIVKSCGLEVVHEKPEVVITFGGDGTLIGAERDFPGIPKLPLKNSQICRRCIALEPEIALTLLFQNKLSPKPFDKLVASVKGQTLVALNDLVIRNKFPNTALRFSATVNHEPFPNLIGDGLVVATAFGATGYFHSITKTSFDAGFGIAFNNITSPDAPLFKTLTDLHHLSITIDREVAFIAADNNPNLVELSPGDKVEINLCQTPAKIYSV